MINVGIIGSTGYAGEYLIRILHAHPEVNLAHCASSHAKGKLISDVLPSLKNMVDITLRDEDMDAIADSCDIVFMAKKSTESMKYAPLLLEKGVRVIDIGGEFRLKDAAHYEKWYGQRHVCPELLDEAVYGLSEHNRDAIRDARLIANPGCYPTGTIIGITPFVKHYGDSITAISISASSGISGGGRSPLSSGANLFVNCFNNHSAYGIGTHKHTPEIEQALGKTVTFVPQLASIDRGILAVSYITVDSSVTCSDAAEILKDAYAHEYFVRIYDTPDQIQTQNVRGTNFCDISATFIERSRIIIVVSAIDNLIKGASGQAVQNMNIMFSLNEAIALKDCVY